MKHLSVRIFCLLAICVASFNAGGQAKADMILYNGKIFTADTSLLFVQAVAIAGNRILATGKDKFIKTFAGASTRMINLQGRTVVPGFNDAHDHLGYSLSSENFFSAEFSIPGPGKKAILDSLAAILKHVRNAEPIGGWIGIAALFDPTMKKSLDSIAPSNPVILSVMWGHGVVVNSAALTKLDINKFEKDPPGGWYARVPGSNEITGALYESTQWPAWHLANTSNPVQMIKGLKAFGQEQLQHGITTVQDMSATFPPDSTISYLKMADLAQRIRIIPMPVARQGTDLKAWDKISRHPSQRLYVSGVKYVIDGTPFEQTAFTRRPYASQPGHHGRLNYSRDHMRTILRNAFSGTTQLMLHITGDSAMSIVLQMMDSIGPGKLWKEKRVRFEHNASAGASADDRRLIRKMGIIMAHTPKYGHYSPLKSLMAEGIIVSVSPDGTTNPFEDILTMTTRQQNPHENISREEAVIAYTRTNAYAEFAEKEKGSLTKGQLADLVVLSADIFSVAAELLPQTTSLLTMIDGKIVYENPCCPVLLK